MRIWSSLALCVTNVKTAAGARAGTMQNEQPQQNQAERAAHTRSQMNEAYCTMHFISKPRDGPMDGRASEPGKTSGTADSAWEKRCVDKITRTAAATLRGYVGFSKTIQEDSFFPD